MRPQDMDRPGGPDGFADCPSCGMHDWSDSEQVSDLISAFWEPGPLVGIYSEMAEVSTCAAKDWSSADQEADLVDLFAVGASSVSIPWTCRILQSDVFCRLDCRCVELLAALVNMLQLHAAILDEAVTAHTTSSYG